jgi:hypothetical protein
MRHMPRARATVDDGEALGDGRHGQCDRDLDGEVEAASRRDHRHGHQGGDCEGEADQSTGESIEPLLERGGLRLCLFDER